MGAETGESPHSASGTRGYHFSMPFPALYMAARKLGRLSESLTGAVLLTTLLAAPVAAAELQPRSYAWLMSHAGVVLVGEVESVSSGLFGNGRQATVRVDGLIKGKVRKQFIDITWNDKEHAEAAYQRDARVVVFAVMKKDSTYVQVAPGISCWVLEPTGLKGKAGKSLRGVEYAYPMDLLTGIPASALRVTEVMEKSMNFQMAKRKQWIVADNLLPAARPLALPKPPKPKTAAKPKPRPKGVKSRKPAG